MDTLRSTASEFVSSHPTAIQVTVALLGLVGAILYKIRTHPLYAVPSVPFASICPFFLWWHTYHATESSIIDLYHKKHQTRVLRVAPNRVSISDGAAISSIYVEKGGMPKAKWYSNFDLNGHKILFSARQAEDRNKQAKAVLPLFAPSSVNGEQGSAALRGCADKMVEGLKKEKWRAMCYVDAGHIDLRGLARAYTIDAVTDYIFKKRYGALDDVEKKLVVDVDIQMPRQLFLHEKFLTSGIAVGRYSGLPHWLFNICQKVEAYFRPIPGAEESIKSIDTFAERLVNDAKEDDNTFQSRLLKAGISKSEAVQQCIDVTFAGTDSTATALTAILFNLVKHPDVYQKLRDELREYKDTEHDQSIPYLRAVVREGLRVALVNPNQLSREVTNNDGWTFGGFTIPKGTVVGVQSYTVHFDEDVYPKATQFKPERWLSLTPEMTRNFMAFSQGLRSCIAQTLATAALTTATRRLVEADTLRGAKVAKEELEIYQWVNSTPKAGDVCIWWPEGVVESFGEWTKKKTFS